MKLALVLFAVCVTSYVVSVILDKLTSRWGQLPHFVRNHVGGVLAVCSITDYKRAVRSGPVIDCNGSRLVFVQGTIALSDSDPFDSAQAFSGSRGVDYLFTNSIEASDLFVPYASEAHFTFKWQGAFFIPPQNPKEFVREKTQENLENDFRLRLVMHRWSGKLDYWRLWSGMATIVMLVVVLLTALGRVDSEVKTRQVTVHLTREDGTVYEVKTTGKDEGRLLVSERDFGAVIVRGMAQEIQYVGGGISRACIQRVDQSLRCGFASSALKIEKGNEVYLRPGNFLSWTHSNGVPGYRNDDDWFITKAEVDNLVATGKFKVID